MHAAISIPVVMLTAALGSLAACAQLEVTEEDSVLEARAGSLAIFDDAVANNFWGAVTRPATGVSTCSSARASRGTCAFSARLGAYPGAIVFGRDAMFATTGYTALEFTIHTNGQPLASFQLQALDSDNVVLAPVTRLAAHDVGAAANGFRRIRVPVSTFNPQGRRLYMLRIQNGTSQALSTATFVDEVALVGSSAPPPPPPASCTRTISPGASVQALVASLSAGQTGCLRAGSYPGDVAIERAGVRLTSYPGERATLRVDRVEVFGADSGLERITVVGSGRSHVVRLYGHRTYLLDSDVTNNNQGSLTSVQCVLVGEASTPADEVRVERNRIHHCGRTDRNLDHAIYAQNNRRLIVRDNLIYAVGGYAVQLYPAASGSVIEHNVIDAAPTMRGGVVIGGDSTGNAVRYNIVVNTATGAVADRAAGNTVANNCTADPRFIDAGARDYRLQSDSPCLPVVQYDTARRLAGESP